MEEIKLNQCGNLNHYNNDQMDRVYSADGLSPTITVKSGGGREPKIIVEGNYSPSGHEASRVISSDGLAPTVKQNHGTLPAVAIKSATSDGCEYAKQGDCINLAYPDSKTRRGRVGEDVAQTLMTNDQMGTITDTEKPKIRKFTEEECFRLMGVKKEDFERVRTNQSQTSLYHLPGDSIVTTCLMAMFGKMFDIDYEQKIRDTVKEIKSAVR